MLPTLFETKPPLSLIATTWREFDRFTIKSPNPHLKYELQRGCLLPALLTLDDCFWHRWDYWRLCHETGELPEARIPCLDILDFPHAGTRKMLEASLDCIPTHGSWQTWGGWQFFDYLLSWILFGFGHEGQAQLPSEENDCSGASARLFQVFCLDALLLWPHNYFGSLLAESSYGKQQGFYPTSHHICEFMTQMLMSSDKDCRRETVCAPLFLLLSRLIVLTNNFIDTKHTSTPAHLVHAQVPDYK